MNNLIFRSYVFSHGVKCKWNRNDTTTLYNNFIAVLRININVKNMKFSKSLAYYWLKAFEEFLDVVGLEPYHSEVQHARSLG